MTTPMDGLLVVAGNVMLLHVTPPSVDLAAAVVPVWISTTVDPIAAMHAAAMLAGKLRNVHVCPVGDVAQLAVE